MHSIISNILNEYKSKIFRSKIITVFLYETRSTICPLIRNGPEGAIKEAFSLENNVTRDTFFIRKDIFMDLIVALSFV